MLVIKSGSVNAWLQQAGSHCAEARRPWGNTTAHHHVEVLGATLDAHWLHAASGVFYKCGLPPYRGVPYLRIRGLSFIWRLHFNLIHATLSFILRFYYF